MMLFKAPIQLPVHNKPLNANGKFFILSGCERQRLYECVSTTTTKKIKKGRERGCVVPPVSHMENAF